MAEIIDLAIGHLGTGRRQGRAGLPRHLYRKHPVEPAVDEMHRQPVAVPFARLRHRRISPAAKSGSEQRQTCSSPVNGGGTSRRRSCRSATAAGSIIQAVPTYREESAQGSGNRCCLLIRARRHRRRAGGRRRRGPRAASSTGSRGRCRCRHATPSPAARPDRACNIPAHRARSCRGCRGCRCRRGRCRNFWRPGGQRRAVRSLSSRNAGSRKKSLTGGSFAVSGYSASCARGPWRRARNTATRSPWPCWTARNPSNAASTASLAVASDASRSLNSPGQPASRGRTARNAWSGTPAASMTEPKSGGLRWRAMKPSASSDCSSGGSTATMSSTTASLIACPLIHNPGGFSVTGAP